MSAEVAPVHVDPIHFGAEAVARGLPAGAGIAVMRRAMIALSAGETRQLPRTMIGMGEGRTFALMPGALMPGALAVDGMFGAKLVSVFPDAAAPGRTLHQGLVVLFEGEHGRVVATADAGAVTKARTAAATAAATDALARPDAEVLALLGCGRQAFAHIEALSHVRRFRRVVGWGRSPDRVRAFAADVLDRLGVMVETAPDVPSAVQDADVVCTLTGAREPILHGAMLAAGTHVNLVGSSGPGPREADDALVARSRFVVESRENAALAAAELLHAQAAGVVGPDAVAAEIGEVFAGAAPGRTAPDEITVYKSIGHVVQDVAAVAELHRLHRAGALA